MIQLLILTKILLSLPTEALLQRHQMNMRLNPPSFSGTRYTITEFPHPTLRRVPNSPITLFNDDLLSKTKEMLGIMYEAKGVGLAAPQIGINEMLFVYNPSDSKNMERIVCNPKITRYSEEIIVEEEACLSLRSDDTAGEVARSAWIETEYQNELGQMVRRRLKGFEARVFQHEYDHLRGILCYDRFPPEDREAVRQSIENLLGLYSGDDALIEPDDGEVMAMKPRPLSVRWMPPLEEVQDDEKVEQKSTKSSGFGMGGGANTKGAGKKKDGKKKVRNRNGAFSTDPRRTKKQL